MNFKRIKRGFKKRLLYKYSPISGKKDMIKEAAWLILVFPFYLVLLVISVPMFIWYILTGQDRDYCYE